MEGFMKKILVVGILFLTLFCYKVYAALDGGAITTTVRSNTQVLIQITTLPTGGVDSVYVCRMTYGGSDTSFVATIDSVTTNKMITGQSPNLHAIYFLKVCGNAGYTISDKDTVTVYPPEIGETVNSATESYVERVIRAISWRPISVLNTFTLDGSAATDSSAVYEPWKTNSVIITATQAGDSVKTIFYVHYGYRVMTQTGEWVGFCAKSESLNVSSAGTWGMTLLQSLNAPSMYYSFGSYEGNGKNASLRVDLKRDRY